MSIILNLFVKWTTMKWTFDILHFIFPNKVNLKQNIFKNYWN